MPRGSSAGARTESLLAKPGEQGLNVFIAPGGEGLHNQFPED